MKDIVEKFEFILGYLDEVIEEDKVFNSEEGFKYLIKSISKKYTKYKENKEAVKEKTRKTSTTSNSSCTSNSCATSNSCTISREKNGKENKNT